jgi:hypothetical protein
MVYNSPTNEEDNPMTQRTNRRQFNKALAAAGALSALSPFGIARAQSKTLKVGVLLPRSACRPASARIAIAAWRSACACCAISACRAWRS